MSKKIVNVIAVEAGNLDKNQREYTKVTFSTADRDELGLRIEPKTQVKVLYPENYLDQSDFGHDAVKGDKFAGDIVTMAGLIPYPIEDSNGGAPRMVTKATHLVLGDSTNPSWDAMVEAEFNRQGKFYASDPNGSEKYANHYKFEAPDLEVAETIAEEATI